MSPLTILIFVAFVPLLWLERQDSRRGRFFGWVYLSMLIWNAAATWWIWNSTAPGAIGAILANSLLMCIPWIGFHFIRKRMGDTIGYLSLVILWLCFEYFHLQNWGLSWPWLTLGNVFATQPDWVQWYEYTGVSGGGLWVLTVNILVFRLLWGRVNKGVFDKRRLLGCSRHADRPGSLVAPDKTFRVSGFGNDDRGGIGDTAGIGWQHRHRAAQYRPLYEDLHGQLRCTAEQAGCTLSEIGHRRSHTVLVIWPETALYMENYIDEDHLKENYFLNPLWNFLRRHPQINLLTGMESFRFFNEKHSASAFRMPDSEKYVESYNAAVILDSSGPVSFYHKSRLVPGVETLPPFLHFLDSWFEKFGGTTGGYTGQADRTPLLTANHSYRIAPAVCYESIYGEFMSRYVQNGADLIAIITNDGWWGNTPGHLQHENYARLRAIETRRWIVRSANTGISCIIDPAGKIIESRPWDQTATIRRSVPVENATMTFYARHGDCISRLAILLLILFFCWNFITLIKTRSSRG